ncbi:MAG TPA: hypothetical protein VFH58_08680 [Acidimicrobiales bacterium]|nr:hypothetical protein [Acidimicrobiales bacterium]
MPMLEQIEGSKAIASVVAACRPQVVCAYPITPQTHIVEALGARVKDGRLAGCRFINVESEFAALSVAIGASATGSRAYTATASQGLLYMAEPVYNAAGLGLPIVMTVANRAIGAPINIWNDHSDAMALRDAGWVQLYAHDNQQAADLHIVAFRLAEQLSVPVMVCVDGFALTHATEAVDVPSQAEVDDLLPPFTPRQRLDPEQPLTIGAMVGPDAFTEVRYLSDTALRQVQQALPAITAEVGARLGRPAEPFVYRYGRPDADTLVVCQGSVAGTLETAIDELNTSGGSFGSLAVTLFRPFPTAALRDALAGARRVVVIERALAPAGLGYLSTEILPALPAGAVLETVVAGLGGRAVSRASLLAELARTGGDRGSPRFLDLDRERIEEELRALP